MSKVTSPPEKKALSLALDRRNAYGENDKASRKSIPRSKARTHRKERRVVEQILSHDHVTAPDDNATEQEGKLKSAARLKRLGGFKKAPDIPLAKALARKVLRQKRRTRAGA